MQIHNFTAMNTIELGVANDPRPDAGLGRLSSDEPHVKDNRLDTEGKAHNSDVESQGSAEGA